MSFIQTKVMAMRSSSRFLVTLICVFIVAYKCASAAAFVQNGIERVQKIGAISSKGICLCKSSNQDVKSTNNFQFSSHVLGYLEADTKANSRNAGSIVNNGSRYLNPYLEILSSRIFRPPRPIA